VVLGLGFAVVDFALRHRSWMRRLRMTRDEVRREQKETEGDPLLRSARRSAHLELHEEATLAELRRAKVLVTTSAQGAVALTYEESDDAPRVLTHGRGELAERMERVALTDGVPVRRDEALAEALFAVKPGSAIPNSLYEAVALLLGELGETPR
jgi:flagellar biosynthesis protein FlhB